MEAQHLETFGSDSGSQSSSGSETLSEGEGIDICLEEVHQYYEYFNNQDTSDFVTLKTEGKEENSVADEAVEPGNREHGEGGDKMVIYPLNVSNNVFGWSGLNGRCVCVCVRPRKGDNHHALLRMCAHCL